MYTPLKFDMDTQIRNILKEIHFPKSTVFGIYANFRGCTLKFCNHGSQKHFETLSEHTTWVCLKTEGPFKFA